MESFRVESNLSVRDVADAMDRAGVVCLDRVIPTEWIAAAESSVRQYVTERGDRDFFVRGSGQSHPTPAYDVVADDRLRAFVQELIATGCPTASDHHLTSCLRVLTGPVRRERPMLLHYDANVVTMVVPIILPHAGAGLSGELVAFPNRRPFRRTLVRHISDKLLTHNALYRRRAVRAALHEPERHVVDMQPGNAYLFWGYRTYHGNLRCAPNELRATLILHFGEPHPDSAFLAIARKLRGRRRFLREMYGEETYLSATAS